MSLAGNLAGDLAGNLAGNLSGGGTPSLAALGADLLHHWEVPAADSPLITLNGSNVSQLNDRVGGIHAVQAVAGNQPAYVANGGPNNQPYINLQDGTRGLVARILPIGAANRTGMYAVFAAGTQFHAIRITQDAVAGIEPYFVNLTAFHSRTEFTGGSQDVAVVTPAWNTAWHLHAMRPLATGALSQIDGVTTNPTHTGSDTLKAMNQADIGSVAGNANGNVAMLILVSDPTASKDAIVKAYVRARYGLSVA